MYNELYNIHMRTNIELDDRLVSQAQRLTGLKTKRAVVHEALRHLVRLYRQRNVRKLRGKLEWHGDLNKTREGRFAGTH